MKYFLTCTLCLFIFHLNYAQSDIPLIPSDSLINKAVQMMDNGKLEESMKLLDKVSSLSPDYPRAQYEYAYAAYSNKEYEKAIEVLNKIPNDSDMNHQFTYHQLKANVYDGLKDTINARESYEYLVEHFPYQASGYFDYALFQIHVDEHYEAAKNLQKALYLNPTFYKAHYLLGILAVENGYYSEGIISCLTAIYLYPENSYNTNALINLNKFLVTVDPDVIKLDLHDGKENPFKDIEKLLKSKFALSNDYDNETKFTDKFMNQIHLFWFAFDKVKETGSFYNEFYIPFWKEVKKDLDFNTLACILHYKIDSKATQREVKKENNNIDKSYEYFSERYSEKLYFRKYDLKGQARKVYYSIENGQLIGVGPYNGTSIHGDWQYIYPAHGVHSSVIHYDENGKAQGDVEFYNLDGTLNKKVTFKDNNLDGWEIYYDKKGRELSRFFYENDKLEKEAITKYPNGESNCVKNFKNNKYDGIYHCYYPDGTKKIELNFKNDIADGNKKYYNVIGNITQDVNFKDDEYHGISKVFYDDGTPSNVENYENGVLVGEQKYFFPNGKLKIVNVYNSKGKLQTGKRYNILGKLVASDTYNSKGESHGDCFDYFNDGTIESITTYKNGGIKKYQAFNYKGDMVQEIKVNNKDLNTYLNILGNPMAKGKKIKNKLQGEWLYFYPNGSVKRKKNFDTNSDNQGESIEYHHNGKISSIMYFEKGKAQGLYKAFYLDGVLKTEGAYFNDKPIGEWRFYNMNGTIYKKSFYDKQGQLIKDQSLNKNEEPKFTHVSENNKLVKIICHGKEDNVFDFADLPKDNTIHFTKNAERYDFQLHNGICHGKDRFYNVLDQTMNEGEFVNSVRHGKRLTYNDLGNLQTETNYIAGVEWGTSKVYNYLGGLSTTGEVKNGNRFGEYTVYYLNGKKRYQFTQQNEEMVSPVKYYGSNGELLFTKYEYNDAIYGYEVNGGEFQEANKGKAQILATYKNGNKGLEIDYNNGAIHGKYNCYYEDGSPYIISTRNYGKNIGVYTEYYPNGQVFFTENYKLGEKHGPTEIFDENGDKIAELNYYYDYLDGEIKIYENKKLKYTKIYDLGNLLEIKVH